MTIRAILIGLGQIGMGYDIDRDPHDCVYTHARALSMHPAFDLVAAVDAHFERRQLFEELYRRPAYAHLECALADHDASLVVIAVDTRHHAEILRRVLVAGSPRIVLCEKPLSYDLAEARSMVDACNARSVALYVNYIRRSDPAVVEVKRRIDVGDFGKPIKGVVWYSKGFLHNGSHFFNLLEYWLGTARESKVLDPGRLIGADAEPDAFVSFAGGSVMFLAAWEEAYSHYTVELLSPLGRLTYEQEGSLIKWQCARPDQRFHGYRVLSADPEIIPSGFDRYQWHVAEQLARAESGDEAHLCSGADALRTFEMMQRVMSAPC